MTTLLPARSSNDEPAGIGASVINSTVWLDSLLSPALLDVLDASDTVDVTWLEVVFPSIKPSITVVTALGV